MFHARKGRKGTKGTICFLQYFIYSHLLHRMKLAAKDVHDSQIIPSLYNQSIERSQNYVEGRL